MTRSKSKPRSRKEPERKTATFREHWNFFVVPFFFTSLLFPSATTLLRWLIGAGTLSEKTSLVVFAIIGVIISSAVSFSFFAKRTALLHTDGPAYSRSPSIGIALFTFELLVMFSERTLQEYFNYGYVSSEFPLFSHKPSETAIDNFMWMMITFIAGNALWMIATCIPVMYRKDLYQYLGKEEENGKL